MNFSKQIKLWLFAAAFFFISKGYAEETCQSQLLGEGIVRFYDPDVNIKDLPPSMSLDHEPEILGKAPAEWKIIPEFGFDKNRARYTATIKIDEGTSLY